MQKQPYQIKAENHLSIWWACWLGLVVATFLLVLDGSLIDVSLGTLLLIFFLMNMYFIPIKMLCIIGHNIYPRIFSRLYEKVLLPMLSIALPFFWGDTSFGGTEAGGNLLYGVVLGDGKLMILIPLFILMSDPQGFLAKNIATSIDLRTAKKDIIFYLIFCHWVWLFPVLAFFAD